MQVIAARDCFDMKVEIPALLKVNDVVFPAGIVNRQDGKASFVCGVADFKIGHLVVDDPFDIA